MNLFFITFSVICLLLPLKILAGYNVGIGIADCTGPSAEIVFMGYGKTQQKGCGIHLRQFSRAFIFDDGLNKAAFVSVDSGMISHGLRRAVIQKLRDLYNNTYTERNLILSGTHTHGAPGGFLMDFLYDIPSFGFVEDTFTALLNGITQSIIRAHENIQKARVYIDSDELIDANINRSPLSYLLNPPEERSRYKYDVDKDMVQLKIVKSLDDTPLGVINWFAVHPTSMNSSNCLITSDNVGYASILFEKHMNPNTLLGKGPFVAAFASTNLGDVSPNTAGPRCVDTGNSCDKISSSCNGRSQLCIASGPGRDMFESTKIIAERLVTKAKEIWSKNTKREVTGPVYSVHRYVDMPKQRFTIRLPNGTKQEIRGCLPAMGYSFAAGTTDGPGEFDFIQGTKGTNPYWDKIRDLLIPVTKEDIECHYPKPILINSGKINTPYQWQSSIVSTQLLQVGNVILISVPGEFTTMSGRRLREAVQTTIIDNGGPPNTRAIISGLSNTYTSYIATPEEYQLQRYEGASTIYGPHTLTIYLELYKQLALEVQLQSHSSDNGPEPPDFSKKLITLQTPVILDTAGWRHTFGDCILEPLPKVKRGDTVKVKFIAGHPRNHLIPGSTFLLVEFRSSDKWIPIATDANWETKFIWKRTSNVRGGSEATIIWEVGPDVRPGIYRIRHFGHYKYIFGGVYPYEGKTRPFQILGYLTKD